MVPTSSSKGASKSTSRKANGELGQPRPSVVWAARLAGSKFNLAWPGDHGPASISSRIYDGFAAGAINVFLGDAILNETIAFARWLPWRDMSVVVDPARFHASPTAEIEKEVSLMERDAVRLHRALALRERHAADVSWTHAHSRVADRVLRECGAGAR